MHLRDTRLAWTFWGVLAIAIAATTLTKLDQLLLSDAAGTRLTGRIVNRDAHGVTFRVRGESLDRIFPASDLALVAPLGDRSVTGNYRLGAERWRTSRPMYSSGMHGFLYMPQAAMLFLPFELLPPRIGEVLWRWVGLAAYAGGVFLLCRRFFPDRLPLAFTIASALAIPASLGSAQNGQTNLIMGGLFALAALHAAQSRWGLTSLWLTLALVCKPVALPVLLLLAATRLRLIPALTIGVLVFAAAPFLHPDPVYVWSQYQASIHKVLLAADPSAEGAFFSDIRGMLRDFGLTLTDPQLLPVRAFAALVFLALSMVITSLASRPSPSSSSSPAFPPAFTTTLLGVAYIMIFNPRTEGVTYAMIGPFAAILATREVLARRWPIAAMLVAYCLILQFSMPITDLITGPGHKYWLRPLATMLLVAWVTYDAMKNRSVNQPPPAQ